ncbi:MAG TPA: hypothetical protein VLA93_10060 [Pyrinomonadaceae bacterium]|nr:hypothetical protein [Pyrinomonadaceae bacterium]
MRRFRKVLLALAILLVLSQLPFVYRRYNLGRLNARIQVVNSNRQPSQNPNYSEYKGVMHVHSFLGGHSRGSFIDIISAARANQLDFVVMTEHAEQDIDTAAMTLKGTHGGVLFINGNEVSTAAGDRLLVVPGDTDLREASKLATAEVAAKARTHGALSFVAYPEEFKSWEMGEFDGVEVFNVYSNARQINPVFAVFDVLWSQRAYPALLFATFYTKPTENLKKWDAALARRRLTATAGNDAHANVGVSLNDGSGKTLVGLQLDPYETSFRLVRLHVLIERGQTLDNNTLMGAIKQSHCFIGFDLLGDTTGFNFTAETAGGTRIQGDEINLQPNTRLRVDLPVSARVVLLKNGQVWVDENAVTSKTVDVTEAGVYRVEAYLPQLGKPAGEQPWIISNPIYVKGL